MRLLVVSRRLEDGLPFQAPDQSPGTHSDGATHDG